MGSTYATCVIQIPLRFAKLAVGHIDNYIKEEGDEYWKRKYTPSRCYVADKDTVLVWRDLPYEGPFITGLLDYLFDKGRESGFEVIHRVYDEDDKVEGKIFRCIPEVPNALCVQYWQFRSIIPYVNKTEDGTE